MNKPTNRPAKQPRPGKKLAHPSDLAPGHNPAKLTVAQVGKGWRLLTRDEIESGRTDGTRVMTVHIEMWKHWEGAGHWDANWKGDSDEQTYRTRKPAGYFLPKITRTASMMLSSELSKPTANKVASDFVYAIHSWRGRSPNFMQAQVRKLEAAIQTLIAQ